MIRPFTCFRQFAIAALTSTVTLGYAAGKTTDIAPIYADEVGLPRQLIPQSKKPILIAIVGDGFRLTHQSLAPFLWTNSREKARNRRDDDGNGFVDDSSGWDFSDNDPDVSIPSGREDQFTQGTHIAGIVTEIAHHTYGENAPEFIKILPIKAAPDNAQRPQVRDGYSGIEYAADLGADVIICSWSNNRISPEESDILHFAEEQGSLVVAAAGDIPSDRDQFPAAFKTVLGVASVESDLSFSNTSAHGKFIDLTAPGYEIASASSFSDEASLSLRSTSTSAAIVGAAAAILKSQHPGLTPADLRSRLKTTATPLERYQTGDILYAGKMGAGQLNLKAALAFDPNQAPNLLRNHQATLFFDSQHQSTATWSIRPEGEIEGIHFFPTIYGDPGESIIAFYESKSAIGEPFLEIPIETLNKREFVPGNVAAVKVIAAPNASSFSLELDYASKPIDQSNRYCTGTVEVTEEGIIDDGSGEKPYSPRSSCKWHIQAPEGKIALLRFLELDTEDRTDWLYLYNGNATNGDKIAIVSGNKLPPDILTWTDQTLLWFITDDANQGAGWTIEVTFVDPPEASAETED